MIKVELIRGRNSKTKKVVVSLFADKREDLISGQEIHGMPDGYSIDFGSSCTTANGEMAYLKSDCATWVWVKVDPTTITLEELDVTENGEYTAESGKAYTPVIVQIPLGNKTVSANGTYTATDDNLQGYSEVTVEVPDPELITKSISTNGTYSAEDDNADGYSQVSVDVQPDLTTKSITANGTYNASSDNADGYSQVSVEVPAPQPELGELDAAENKTYYASDYNFDGFDEVRVDVTPNLQDLTIYSAYDKTYSPEDGHDGFSRVDVRIDKLTLDADHNGEYTPAQSADVWSKVNVNVQPNVSTLNATENRTYSASDEGYDGYSQVTVAVPQSVTLGTLNTHLTSMPIYPSAYGLDGFDEVNINAGDQLIEKEITANGIYSADEETGDLSIFGYSSVNVHVSPNVSTKSINKNGTYNASSDNVDGYSQVSVNVQPNLTTLSVTENGSYAASGGSSDGFSQVDVAVPEKALTTRSVDENGIYYASDEGYDGFSEVVVSVHQNTVGEKSSEITENGTYYANDDNLDGYSEVTVNVSTTANLTSYSFSGDDFTSGAHTIYPEDGYDGFSEISYDYNSEDNYGVYQNGFLSTVCSGYLITGINVNVKCVVRFTSPTPPEGVSFDSFDDDDPNYSRLEIHIPRGSKQDYLDAGFPENADYVEED